MTPRPARKQWTDLLVQELSQADRDDGGGRVEGVPIEVEESQQELPERQGVVRLGDEGVRAVEVL